MRSQHLDPSIPHLFDQTIRADYKRLPYLLLAASEPPCSDKAGGNNLLQRHALETKTSEALRVGRAALCRIVGHEDALLAQTVEQVECLDRAWQQSIVTAPEHTVTVEEEGIVIA